MGRALSGQVPISAPRGRHKFSSHPCIYSQFKLHKSNPFGCTFIPYSYHINTICFFFLFLGFFGKKLVTLCLQIKSIHTLTHIHTITFSISYWMALQYQATFNLICCSTTQNFEYAFQWLYTISVWANKYVICHINFSLLLRCKLIQIRLFTPQLINHVEMVISRH